MNTYCAYIAQYFPFQKKEEANEIQRSQNKFFLFNTSEDTLIFLDVFEQNNCS